MALSVPKQRTVTAGPAKVKPEITGQFGVHELVLEHVSNGGGRNQAQLRQKFCRHTRVDSGVNDNHVCSFQLSPLGPTRRKTVARRPAVRAGSFPGPFWG